MESQDTTPHWLTKLIQKLSERRSAYIAGLLTIIVVLAVINAYLIVQVTTPQPTIPSQNIIPVEEPASEKTTSILSTYQEQEDRAIPFQQEEQWYAYITNSLSDDVSVIDLEANQEVARIPVLKEPSDSVLLGNKLYVTTTAAGAISVINILNNKMEDRIQLKTQPFVITTDGTVLYILSEDTNDLTMVNPETKEKKVLELPARPTNMILTEDMLYLTSANGNKVLLVRLPEKKFIGTIRVNERPAGLAITKDRRMLYVANAASNDISVVTVKLRKQMRSTPVSTTPVALTLSPDDKQLYVTNRDANTISIIDTALDKVIGTIPTNINPLDIVLDQNTGKLYATAFYASTLEVIDPVSRKVEAEVSTGKGPSSITLAKLSLPQSGLPL